MKDDVDMLTEHAEKYCTSKLTNYDYSNGHGTNKGDIRPIGRLMQYLYEDYIDERKRNALAKILAKTKQQVEKPN
jgi:hypothetical protein